MAKGRHRAGPLLRLAAKRAGLMRDCAKIGHRFVTDEDGYHCTACPLRIDGDGKPPPPTGGGSGERKAA